MRRYVVLALLACHAGPPAPEIAPEPVSLRESAVVVPASPADFLSPSIKATACTYSGRVIARCEAMLATPPLDRPEALLADAERFDSVVARRESAYIDACMSRSMPEARAVETLRCLNGMGHCGHLRACVGEDFRGADRAREERIAVMFQSAP